MTTPERRAARADALERRAEALERLAAPVLDPPADHYSRTYTFLTQPGVFSLRTRWHKAVRRATDRWTEAQELRAKAARLRALLPEAREAAAERRQEAQDAHAARRQVVRGTLRVGDVVRTTYFGTCTVAKVNRTTFTTERGTKIDMAFVVTDAEQKV